jgi:hypothetical protein
MKTNSTNKGAPGKRARRTLDTKLSLPVPQEQGLAVRQPLALSSEASTEATNDHRVDALIPILTQVTGVRDEIAADHIMAQAGMALVHPGRDEVGKLEHAVALMKEMAPQNATEAMLATQMIAVNEAALNFLTRANLEGQPSDGVDRNVVRAARLMRVFSEQAELMQKLKGKSGQQKVVVEHVHVHEGGQAIVGAVNTRRGGGRGATKKR